MVARRKSVAVQFFLNYKFPCSLRVVANISLHFNRMVRTRSKPICKTNDIKERSYHDASLKQGPQKLQIMVNGKLL